MPSANSCLFTVICFAEYQYQTESKRDKNGRRIILEYLGFSGGRINAKQCPRWPQDRGRALPPGRAWHPRGPPVRRLTLFFCRKKANFWKKNTAKVSGQSELRISIYIYETVKGQQRETQKQRETERHIQSRRASRPFRAMEAMDQRGNPSPI